VRRRLLLMAIAASVAALVGWLPFRQGHPRAHAASLTGIHKIRHVVVVMQENRSFDSYFGTYPGADGLPRRDGRFTVCVPDPKTGICQQPYHAVRDRNTGGPHEHFDAIRDIDGGKMDGFLRQARHGLTPTCSHPRA
jgi:phospholipase C